MPQLPNICPCTNVMLTRWRVFRRSEPTCYNKPHKPVRQGLFRAYDFFSKLNDKLTEYPHLNKLCVHKVSSFPFPFFCFFSQISMSVSISFLPFCKAFVSRNKMYAKISARSLAEKT